MIDISTASLISEAKLVKIEQAKNKERLLRQTRDNLNKLLALELPDYVLEVPQPPMAKSA